MCSRSKDLGLQQTHGCSGDDSRVQQRGQLCSHLSLTAGSHSENSLPALPSSPGEDRAPGRSQEEARLSPCVYGTKDGTFPPQSL